MLRPIRDHQYAGFSYEQASRRAQEVCLIAGETGQTLLAAAHLAALAVILQRG